MNGLKRLFNVRETYIGILAAIAFQLIFFCVWMTAYDGVNDRIGNLNIAIVNEDALIGEEIATEITRKIPLNVEQYVQIEKAKSAMNERKVDMIVQIPATLTESLKAGLTPEITYWINQSNASLSKSLMESSALQLNDQLNQHLFSMQKIEVTGLLAQQLHTLPLHDELANSIGENILSAIDILNDKPIETLIKKTNHVDGFAANFVPLMIIISSFVGAMVLTMQLEAAAGSLKEVTTKWELFFARQMINFATAFLLAFLTMGLMNAFQIQYQESFLIVYLFQSILFWAFLSLAQVFVLLFGNPGMLLNIFALSLQLVTSGVLVPKALLSEWYIKISSLLPATYGADGYYTILFGGNSSNIIENIQHLLSIICITLLVALGATAVKHKQKRILT